MNRGTKKLLIVMLILLILLVASIIFLMVKDKKTTVKPVDNSQMAVIQPEEEQPVVAPEDIAPVQEETTTAEPTVVDLPNEKEVRLYHDYGNDMVLVTQYSSMWNPGQEMPVFEAFNSTEDEFYYDNYYTIHQQVWDSVDTATIYKIGYELSFDVNGEHKVYTIRQPKDITDTPDLFMGDADNDTVTGYMGVWVYCDIGQQGVYQHLTQAEYSPNSLLTSIKLRPTPQSTAVSNMKLKAFSYSSEEEFNSKGQYIGTHGYEIAIVNE